MKPRLRRLYDLQKTLCAYCRRVMTKPSLLPPIRESLTATIDHRTPVSRGGTDRHENLVAACAECNGIKGDMSWTEWVAYMATHPAWYVRPLLDQHKPPGGWQKPKPKLTAGETAEWLRDQGVLSLLDWPWLIELTRPRVRQVGWGPWSNS